MANKFTAAGLFRRRLAANAKFQYKVWRMAVDWTVALYIVIPLLLFVIYQYVQWWNTAPAWLARIPYRIFSGLFYVYSLTGSIRTFLEEGDQLFLFQRKRWFNRMMSNGMLYSIIVYALTTLLFTMMLAPLLVKGFGVSFGALIFIYILTFLFKIHILLVKQWLGIRWQGWRAVLLRGTLTLLASPLFMYVLKTAEDGWAAPGGLCLILVASLVYFIGRRLRWKGTLLYDIRRDYEVKMKVAGILLSGFVRKKPKLFRNRPLLFRRSNRLFRKQTQEWVLAEAVIKAAFRNPAQMRIYLYSSAAYTSAVMIAGKGQIRWLLLIAAGFLLSYMAKLFAKELVSEPFVQMFHWRDGTRFRALRIAAASIMLPCFLWLTLLAGLLELPLWGAVLLLPAGVVYGIIAAQTVCRWGG